MRLTQKQIKAITTTFKEIFKEGEIYLFGSRVDDSLKGGDIDLYIDTKDLDDIFDKKIDFLVSLKRKIGEQKIDVVISRDKNRPIEQEAIKKGLILDSKKLRVEKYLNECKKHKLRVEKSYTKVGAIFPITSIRYENLSDDEIEAIDQYLFRFAKLQDTIGQKLFKMVVSEYIENIDQLAFLDILNNLEKIGVVDSAIWSKLRDIRNSISHQYDDEPAEMAEALNSIFAYKDELLKVFENIEKFYKAKQ